MRKNFPRIASTLLAFFLFTAVFAISDEGMYPPNMLPLKMLKEKYGFVPGDAWLTTMQRAAVRFPNGSGSFVSANGLVMTNHHIGVDWAQRLSTAKKDLVKNGFVARTMAQEKKCKGLDLLVLERITDITDRAEGGKASVLSAIESEESKRTGLKCEAVSLWNGAKFHLYCYKRYTDVRLAFIPENSAAQFGGDTDNFEYPRFNLDAAFFRVYENGKPTKTPIHFGWRQKALAENELVFTSGHPGRTDRWHPVSTYKYYRDVAYPGVLDLLRRREIALQQFSIRNAEHERIAKEELFSIQNSPKAYFGKLQKIQDPSFMDRRLMTEADLLLQSIFRQDIAAQYSNALDEISSANAKSAASWREWRLFGAGSAFWSNYFNRAQTIIQIAEERAAIAANHSPGSSSPFLESLIEEVLSSDPVYPELEKAMLGESLTYMTDMLGGDHPLVQKILDGKTPRERAKELINDCQLGDIAYRKNLIYSRTDEILASNNSMLQLARLMDPEMQKWQKFASETAFARKKGYAKMYAAMNALNAVSDYPDATFTLRLSVGVVKGYEEDGKRIPHATTFAGLFTRAAEHRYAAPWDLPSRWRIAKQRIRLNVPYNFVSTNDITGGNSGSPVFDRDGNIVGLIFDGNIQSLGNDLEYLEKEERAVSVSAQGIIEALRKVYRAHSIVNELLK